MTSRRKTILIFALAIALTLALAGIILDEQTRVSLGTNYYVISLSIIGCIMLLLSGFVWDRSVYEKLRVLGGKTAIPDHAAEHGELLAGETDDHDEIISLARQIERMAQALQKTEASYRGIVEDQIDLICRYKPDGRLTFVNGAYARFYGKTRQELLGQTFIPYEKSLKNQLNLNTPPPVASFEYQINGSDGSPSWYLWTNRPITARDGTLLEFQAVGHDVTLRREAEAAMRQAKDAAESADRAKSEFLAIVSHEIRTPINGVVGFTRLLSETGLNLEQREYTEMIRTSGQSLQVLINDLLDLSKIEAGKIDLEPAPFAPRKLIEEVCAFYSHKAIEAGLTLEAKIDPALPTVVTGDQFRLRQILNNLISNAVKFTERGGITIKVSVARGEGATSSQGGRRATTLCFTISDTGIGIPADKLHQLFKPFSQVDTSLKRKHGGTGLGLSISKRLCELMGGEIVVESRLGEGSSFSFTVCVELDRGDSVHPIGSRSPY